MMMETQLKLSPESSGKSARQSLNFKPMSVSLPASADSTTQAEPSPASVTKEGISSTPGLLYVAVCHFLLSLGIYSCHINILA